MPTLHGFDQEKLDGFAKYAEENPNEVQLGLSARTFWEGEGGGSLAKIGPWKLAGEEVSKPTRDFSIQFGAWKEVEEEMGIEGASDRIEPVEAALAALCSCVNWSVSINAARQGLDLDDLEISARANVDPRVLFGVVPVEEAASCLQSVELDIEVEGDLTDEEREQIYEMAQRSPVHSLLTHSNTLTTSVK